MHEAPITAGSGEGQMYAALTPSSGEVVSAFWTHDAKVAMEQPYRCAKVRPQNNPVLNMLPIKKKWDVPF